MKKLLFTFKNDRYKQARGEYSRFLNIYCNSCKTHLLLYQKDGPGPLKRMYVDRIFAPKLQTGKKELICKNCKKIIGTFYIYQKEDRPAIRLYQDSVIKKVGQGTYPPSIAKL